MKLVPSQLSGDEKKVHGEIRKGWQILYQILAGQVSYGDGVNKDNIDGVWATAVSVAGNFTVTHNLGRVPVGYHVVKSTGFENVKFISATTSQITLAGQTGGSTLTLFIF